MNWSGRVLMALGVMALFACSSESSNLPTGELWSDPNTWPSNQVPAAGDDVVIPAGKQILLDVSPPRLGSLTIDGTLVFDDRDLDLDTGWVVLHGALRIGSEDRLHQHDANITLSASDPAQSIMQMGTRGILVMGGTLDLHAEAPSLAWTKINAMAGADSRSVTLSMEANWKAGDQVALAPTDFFRIGRTELHTISSIQGREVSFLEPLERVHWGVMQYVDSNGVTLEPSDSVTSHVLDQRAEIGNLTRKIRIQAPDDDLWKNEGFGAHVMMMEGSQARIEGVELRRVGQAGRTARYPIHWHLVSYTAGGTERSSTLAQYIRDSSIWESAQRCVVLHGTNDVTVKNNVCYDIQGHAIFLEDAVERRNVLEDNLVLHVHRPDPARRLLNHDDKAAGFWLTNPDNVVRGNVVADSEGIGFWLAYPEHSLGVSSAVPLEPTFLPFGTFDDNTAHSNGIVGIMFDEAPSNEAGDIIDLAYRPLSLGTPTDGSVSVPFSLNGITIYKHETSVQTDRVSFWNRALGSQFRDFVISDFNGTAFSGSSVCEISSALVVGESLNNENLPLLRSGDSTMLPGATPIGAASYHSDCDIFDNVFVNLPAVPNRPSGAFGTSDYYITGVDKGLSRNPNNLLINTHPGYRAVSPNTLPVGGGREHFALSGALWDAYGYWGPAGHYWVYDLPFLTHGTECSEPLQPHGNDRTCVGPYYGVNTISLDDLDDWDPAQSRPIHVARLDNESEWFIDDGNCTAFLGNMRHFSTVRGGRYALTFPPGVSSGDSRTGTPGDQIECAAGLSPGSPAPRKVRFRVTNLLEAEDHFLLAVAYSGTVTPTVYATIWRNPNEIWNWDTFRAWQDGNPNWRDIGRGDHWHPIVSAPSLQDVESSDGRVFYHDTANDRVWLKVSRLGMTFLDDATTANYRLYHDVIYSLRDEL